MTKSRLLRTLSLILVMSYFLLGCSQKNPEISSIRLSFDDNYVTEWHTLLPMLEEFDAKVTFFVCCVGRMDDREKQALTELHQAGHSIQAHGELHVSVNKFVKQEGFRSYLKQEIDNNIDQLNASGIQPTHFALPFGEHNKWLVLALWQRFQGIRDVLSLTRHTEAIVKLPLNFRERRWIKSAELENANFHLFPWDSIANVLKQQPTLLYLHTHRPGVEAKYELSLNNIENLLEWGKREGFRFESF